MEQDSEKIKLKPGESTRVIFKGLGTAGYQWNYTIDKNDLIDISKDLTMPSSKNEQAIGAGADEVFTITANKKGVATIYFFQKRSWEKEAVNERRMAVEIV